MTQTLTVSVQDVVSAYRLHATPKPSIAAIFLLLATAGIGVSYSMHLAPIGAALGAAVGMYGWLAVLFFVIIPYRSRRIYRQQKSLHLEHQFEWDDQFLYFSSQDYEGKIRWADFIKVKESCNMLLLYRSDALFQMMPRRCFSSGKSFEDFKSHLSLVRRDSRTRQ